MPKIILDIKNCKQCPHLKEERLYTSDSWELAYDWFCMNADMKKIEGYVEWHEEKKVEIPTWCPNKII